MNTKQTRGFTLIELLVVIAIIGILSSVVLASLNTARTKGNDASVKSNLSNAMTQGELFYDAAGNTYAAVCGTASVGTPAVKSVNDMVLAAAKAVGITSVTVGAVGSASNAVCNHSATAWAAQVPLKNPTGFFCVDNDGNGGVFTATKITTTSDTSCL